MKYFHLAGKKMLNWFYLEIQIVFYIFWPFQWRINFFADDYCHWHVPFEFEFNRNLNKKKWSVSSEISPLKSSTTTCPTYMTRMHPFRKLNLLLKWQFSINWAGQANRTDKSFNERSAMGLNLLLWYFLFMLRKFKILLNHSIVQPKY